jgi:putative phosphoribosyl transferase
MNEPFKDRRAAGSRVAELLTSYRGTRNVRVLGLPRGGVPVAYEVATALGVPLDVLIVRKLGVPGHEELAMGAIASGGVRIVNERVAREYGLSERALAAAATQEEIELERRERLYLGDRFPLDLEGATVILVDDGLATGATMRAAIVAVRSRGAAKIVVAVPCGSSSTCRGLATEADEVICAITPEPFDAVGLWYRDFTQTTDDEVRDLLERSGHLTTNIQDRG